MTTNDPDFSVLSDEDEEAIPRMRHRIKKEFKNPQRWVKGQIVRCGKRFGHVLETKHLRVVVSFPDKVTMTSAQSEIITFHANGTLLGEGEVLLFNNESEKDVLDATCLALNIRLRKTMDKISGAERDDDDEDDIDEDPDEI